MAKEPGNPNDNLENRTQLDVKDLYGPLVELAIHGQDNKLNLFSSFLFFQSILLLAWATVWQTDMGGRLPILLAISVFGTVSSIVWAAMGPDYAESGGWDILYSPKRF